MSEEESSEEDHKIKIAFKLLLMGDSQVGKTSLLLNYTEHIFPEEHIATIITEISKINGKMSDEKIQEIIKSVKFDLQRL